MIKLLNFFQNFKGLLDIEQSSRKSLNYRLSKIKFSALNFFYATRLFIVIVKLGYDRQTFFGQWWSQVWTVHTNLELSQMVKSMLGGQERRRILYLRQTLIQM